MQTANSTLRSARAGRWIGACAAFCLLSGCASGAHRPGALGAPGAGLGAPDGLVWSPDEPRPPIPVIDLGVPGAIARTTCVPTMIDTRDFPVSVQDVSGVSPRLVKTMLPPHTRPAQRVTDGVAPVDLPAISLPTARTAPLAAFQGIGQTPLSPPDPTLAVGPSHIVQTVNSAVAFYTKDGAVTFQAPLDSTGVPGFFETVGGREFVFDPKCTYDHLSGRFIIIALEVYGTTQSFIDIAISDDSDPNGVWHRYRTNSVIGATDGMTFWADFPSLAFDEEAVYVVSNLFGLNNPNFGGTIFRTFPKALLMAGDPVTFIDLREPFAISLQAAEPFGTNAAPYFVSIASNTQIQLDALIDPLGTPTLQRTTVDVPAFAYPTGLSPTPGGNLGTLDGRVMNATARDGSLFTAHAILASGRLQVRWYEIDTRGWPHGSASPTLTQSGAIDLSPSLHTIFPAIHQNRHGDIGIVMGSTSATTNPRLYVTGRRAADAPGATAPPTLVVTSLTAEPGRWGDYFDITTDPTDDATFWYVGQHHAGGWRTQIGSFVVTCAADVNADATLDASDFLDFIEAFGACEGQPGPCVFGGIDADFNEDTLVDILDFLDFLDAYGSGC